MKEWLTGHALSLVLKVLLGPLTYVIGRWLLNGWHWIDDLSPWVKRAIVFVLAIAIAALFQALGLDFPVECAGVPLGQVTDACTQALVANPVLSGVLAALVALLLHAKKKEPPNA